MSRIAICTAMCDSNRGIGLGGGFPWPFLKHDYEYYTALTRRTQHPDKKVAHIKGRHTWLSTCLEEKSAPSIINVVISSSLREDSDPHLHKVVQSFDEAVDYLTSTQMNDVIETIWVMGGTKVYECAMSHARCSHLYLTRVFGNFEADTFFPNFEEHFLKSSQIDQDEKIEDSGVTYQFEVYARRK